MDLEYSPEPIEAEDLCAFADKALKCLSLSDKKDFVNSVKLIALCQGGGLHYAVTHEYAKGYLDPAKNGLKDIDIWFFFKKEPNKKDYDPQKILKYDFGISKFGKYPKTDPKYKGRNMDIIGRSIEFYDTDTPCDAVIRWLNNGWDTSGTYYQNYCKNYKRPPSSYKLAEKAVVAIYPNEFFEKVLWVNPKIKIIK
jgi:hypothetical protein